MLTGSLLRLPAIKVMNMEQSRCNADAKHIRHFLDICDGNWHSCIYVRCVSCKTPGYCNGPHFLYHPDENGSPCVLPMADARMLFSRIPEPTECLSAITLEQFQSLYGLYFAKEALLKKTDSFIIPFSIRQEGVFSVQNTDILALTWHHLIRMTMESIGGRGALKDLYALLKEHPKAKKNPHYQERIRATLYEHPDEYIPVSKGYFRLSYSVT